MKKTDKFVELETFAENHALTNEKNEELKERIDKNHDINHDLDLNPALKYNRKLKERYEKGCRSSSLVLNVKKNEKGLFNNNSNTNTSSSANHSILSNPNLKNFNTSLLRKKPIDSYSSGKHFSLDDSKLIVIV